MKTCILFATVLLMSFSGCDREDVVKPANAATLIGHWRLVEPDRYNVTLIIDPVVQTWEKLPLKLFALSGESAVNLYNASLTYKASDQAEIAIDSISSTKRGGTVEAMQFEQTYYASLKAVKRYELTPTNQLRFYHDGGVLVYEKTK